MLTLCLTKGIRTCITSQVTQHSNSAGANNSVRRPQNTRYINCELIKTQWFHCSGVPSGDTLLELLHVAAKQWNYLKETQVWDSAMGNLGSSQWRNLTTFCVVCVGVKQGSQQLTRAICCKGTLVPAAAVTGGVRATARVAPGQSDRKILLTHFLRNFTSLLQ